MNRESKNPRWWILQYATFLLLNQESYRTKYGTILKALVPSPAPSRGGLPPRATVGTKFKVVPTLLRPGKSSCHLPSVCLQCRAPPGFIDVCCWYMPTVKFLHVSNPWETKRCQACNASWLLACPPWADTPCPETPWVVILTGEEVYV